MTTPNDRQRALDLLRILEEDISNSQIENTVIAAELQHARDALTSSVCPENFLEHLTENLLDNKSPDDDAETV